MVCRLSLELSEIHDQKNTLSGSTSLDLSPNSHFELGIYENHLSSPVDLTRLLRALLEFYFHSNHYHGEIRLSGLPAALRIFSVPINKLCNTMDCVYLPNSLKILLLDSNASLVRSAGCAAGSFGGAVT